MDTDSPGVIDQLREASADGGLTGGTVEIDAAAVEEILGKLRAVLGKLVLWTCSQGTNSCWMNKTLWKKTVVWQLTIHNHK